MRSVPPWERPELFPVPLAAETYGYLDRGQRRRCSFDELIDLCGARKFRQTLLVWTPQTPRLVPITEVPLLADALESRISASRSQSVRLILLGGMIGSMHLIERGHGGAPSGFGMPDWLIVLIVVGAAESLLEARTDQRALDRRRDGEDAWAPDLRARFQHWLATRKTVFTRLIAASVSIVAACQVIGGPAESVEAAGLVKDAVRRGEVWRLLTGAMLHGGLWHFAGNMGALLEFGRATEALAGRGRAAMVLLASCLAGSIMSVLCLPQSTSVGLSGGLMGLLGFLIVMGHRYKDVVPPVYVRSLVKGALWVAAAGLIGYAYIDNAAHVGGFIAGVSLGFLLAPAGRDLPLDEGPLTRAIGHAALAVLVVAAVVSAALALGLI